MKKPYIRRFREILRMFDRELYLQNNASCCKGISLAQCHTLLEIEQHGELSVSGLASNLCLDKSTVSRTVDGLVSMQMANRTIPEENRRLALIGLTESGKQVCTDINYTNDRYLGEVLKDFTEDEKEKIVSLLEKLTRSMSAYRNKSEQEDASGQFLS